MEEENRNMRDPIIMRNNKWPVAMLCVVLLCYLPIFYNNIGFIILALFLALILDNRRYHWENLNEQCFFLLMICLAGFKIINALVQGSISRVNIIVVTIVSILFFEQYLYYIRSMVKRTYAYLLIARVIYYCIYILAAQEIVKAIKINGLHMLWGGYFFQSSYHYVDWSVMMIMLFIFGIKTHSYVSTFIMTAIWWMILPARMYKLFILSFCAIFILMKIFGGDGINRFLKKNKSFYLRLTILLLVLSVGFAYFWIIFVVQNNNISSTRDSLNDKSNYQRFSYAIITFTRILNRYVPWLGLDELKYTMLSAEELKGVYPHNSYLEMILEYGLLFTVCLWRMLGKLFDKLSNCLNNAFIISYMLCACILHNMFEGWRLFAFLALLCIPEFESKYSFLMKHDGVILQRGKTRERYKSSCI
ncbi:MAG: hypothetical protein E7254_12350 [Lachnospiraceae bacterium]|nr:hypothetical protein [Lachnospiraceae bacterium]